MIINCFIIIFAYLIISMATTYNYYEAAFYFALLSSVLHGISTSLGGCTILGFCKGFPSELVGYYSSGTGFAGIFGSGILLLLKEFGLTDNIIFMIVCPSSILYLMSFYWLHKIKQRYQYVSEDEQ